MSDKDDPGFTRWVELKNRAGASKRFSRIFYFELKNGDTVRRYSGASHNKMDPVKLFKKETHTLVGLKFDVIIANRIKKGCAKIREGNAVNLTFQEGPSVTKILASDIVKKSMEHKPVVVSIDIETQKRPKEYIPIEDWFMDTGILTPIKAGIKFNKAVLLTGETGTGKTSSIRYLAAQTKNGFRRVNLNGSTTVDEFVGRWKLNKEREMVWLDGVLTEAMRKGLWLLCDEINACLPEISFVLHSLLDDDKFIVLTSKDGEIVRPHEDFRFFASMNPEYAGTHELNHALQDRFPIVIDVQYPNPVKELKIVTKRSENTDRVTLQRMVAVAGKARYEYKEEKLSAPFSTRRLIDWAYLAKLFDPEKAFAYAVLNKIPMEDRKIIKDIADAIFPGDMFKNVLKI